MPHVVGAFMCYNNLYVPVIVLCKLRIAESCWQTDRHQAWCNSPPIWEFMYHPILIQDWSNTNLKHPTVIAIVLTIGLIDYQLPGI